jgi:hypothetical protein
MDSKISAFGLAPNDADSIRARFPMQQTKSECAWTALRPLSFGWQRVQIDRVDSTALIQSACGPWGPGVTLGSGGGGLRAWGGGGDGGGEGLVTSGAT